MSLYLKSRRGKRRRAEHHRELVNQRPLLSKHPIIRVAAGVAAGALLGTVLKRVINVRGRNVLRGAQGVKDEVAPKRSERLRFNAGFTGESGAATETTGGHPEDMNGMPAAVEDRENSVYDGADLSRRAI